jgi:hypothetical protein
MVFLGRWILMDPKAAEQLVELVDLACVVIILERAEQRRFAEPSRTQEEQMVFVRVLDARYEGRLVDVKIPLLANLDEVAIGVGNLHGSIARTTDDNTCQRGPVKFVEHPKASRLDDMSSRSNQRAHAGAFSLGSRSASPLTRLFSENDCVARDARVRKSRSFQAI